ncbi:MAG: ATP-binding cassette domain-containing protein [Planctomycetota bacterium]
MSRVFDREIVLNDVSFMLADGSVTTLLGANGAGKSTLIKIAAGMIHATVGKVLLDGFSVKPSRVKTRKQFMVLDELKSNDVCCNEYILRVLVDYEVNRDGLADEAAKWFERLNLLGVYGKQMRALSKGQRFKIGMIALFLVNPSVWLLDEPYSHGLDANGLEVLNEQIQVHRERGGIVLFSSQWPQQALTLADQVLILHLGSLVWNQAKGVQQVGVNLDAADRGLRAVLQQVVNHE